MKALLIDHDDSFTYNLQDWLRPLFTEVQVVNHREIEKNNSDFDLIVLSPGPKSPQDYPHVLEYIQKQNSAIYGVCLGLQMMVHTDGSQVQAYTPPLHGKKSLLKFENSALSHLNKLNVARYHSLKCSHINQENFETLAVAADDGAPMCLRHKRKKWLGVQFHPESFMTEKPELHLQFLKDWLNS